MLEKLAGRNPALAKWIKDMDTVPIIKECVQNAIEKLKADGGIRMDKTITDYYGKTQYKSHEGLDIIGAIKTDALPNGMGIAVDAKGTVKFIADEYRSGWQAEIKRLQGLFQDVFLQETAKTILSIIGYKVDTHTSVVDDPETGEKKQVVNIVGVAQ
ncbi:hypothetical protein HYR65_03045 [Candidatus Azambacteria bacterium]|nr:hypothetical protein [Candidatus Azambacteria bacterium]